MNEYGIKNPNSSVAELGLKNVSIAHWNLSPAELVEETILQGMGELTDTGALAIDTFLRPRSAIDEFGFLMPYSFIDFPESLCKETEK